MTAFTPAPWNPNDPEEFRAIRLREALFLQRSSVSRFAARHQATYYDVMVALARPAVNPPLIQAIDAYIAKHIQAVQP